MSVIQPPNHFKYNYIRKQSLVKASVNTKVKLFWVFDWGLFEMNYEVDLGDTGKNLYFKLFLCVELKKYRLNVSAACISLTEKKNWGQI